MSAAPRVTPAPPAKRRPVTISSLSEKKALGEPLVMITAYDYPSAKVAEEAAVGDRVSVLGLSVAPGAVTRGASGRPACVSSRPAPAPR